jgi:hypothetical protein
MIAISPVGIVFAVHGELGVMFIDNVYNTTRLHKQYSISAATDAGTRSSSIR